VSYVGNMLEAGWALQVRCGCGHTARLDKAAMERLAPLSRVELLARAKCSACGNVGADDCYPVEGGWRIRGGGGPSSPKEAH
jgi:hypothetical protein